MEKLWTVHCSGCGCTIAKCPDICPLPILYCETCAERKTKRTNNTPDLPDEIWVERDTSLPFAFKEKPPFINTQKYIRADLVSAPNKPAEVDLDALKMPEPIFNSDYSEYRRGYERGKQLGWNDCIDHLHAQGYLSAKLPKIDGLDEALDYYGPDNAGEMRLFDTTGEDFTRQFKALISAARAYRERMG